MGLLLANKYNDIVDNGNKVELFITSELAWSIFFNVKSKQNSDGIEPNSKFAYATRNNCTQIWPS